MKLERRLRFADGRVRVGLRVQRLENTLDLSRRGVAQVVTGD